MLNIIYLYRSIISQIAIPTNWSLSWLYEQLSVNVSVTVQPDRKLFINDVDYCESEPVRRGGK